jgi:phage tail-like protein
MSPRTPDGTALMALLPDVIASDAQPNSALLALLIGAESMTEPDAELLDGVDALFDPWATPEPLVAMLAAWVGYDWLASWPTSSLPPGRLRAVVASAPTRNRTRGTSGELVAFLHTLTGIDGFSVIEGGSRPFHITVLVPSTAPDSDEFQALLERAVAVERPVHVTFDIVRNAVV